MTQENSLKEEIKKCVDEVNIRGLYGARGNFKKLSEEGLVRDFLEQLGVEWERPELEVEPADEGKDPPDFFIKKRWGVECVELCDRDRRKKADKKFKENPESKNLDRHTPHSEWNLQNFQERIEEILNDKSEKYQKNSKFIDLLLIGTTEHWLMPSKAKEWADEIQFAERPQIASAFLVLSNNQDGYEMVPPIKLFGDISNLLNAFDVKAP